MPEPDLNDYLACLLASAHRGMRLGLVQSISNDELNEEHWRILQVLSDAQGHSMGELAERVLLSGPALTKNIDKLVRRGVVQRAVDANNSRCVLVFISDLGLEVVERLIERIDAKHEGIEFVLGTHKTAQLKKFLETFLEARTGGNRPRQSCAGITDASAKNRGSSDARRDRHGPRGERGFLRYRCRSRSGNRRPPGKSPSPAQTHTGSDNPTN